MLQWLSEEKEQDTNGQKELREKVKNLEDDLERTLKEKDNYEYEIQKVKQHKNNFDQQYDDLKWETLKVRNDFESTTSQINRLELQNSQL